MRQLAGGDDIWFAADTDHTPMHILEVGIYDPSGSEMETVDLAAVTAFLRKRLGGLPLRQRLLEVPWNADFPYWIEDEHFDLERHLHHVELQPPGDWPALLAALEAIVEVPLDRSRPLWEMHLITGLKGIEGVPDGCFALARKVHHGQFDGTNIMRLSRRIHTTEPGSTAAIPDDWRPERTPSGLELLLRSSWNRSRRLWKGAEVLRRSAPKLLDLLGSQGRGSPPDGAGHSIPPTRFSHGITTRKRVFDASLFPLAEAKAMRRLVDGATLNDVALAIATGAIRRYLDAHGELPADPIVILAPVSAHEQDEKEGTGNRLSIMTVSLPTHVGDPIERLRLVRESTGRSKQATRKVGAGNVADLIDILPTYLFGPVIEAFHRLRLSEVLPLPLSGISITNVPGPRTPSYFNGARLVRGIGCPFLFDGIGLIIAISSYCEDFLIAFGSNPELMPDPDFFRDCVRQAWDELAAVVGQGA